MPTQLSSQLIRYYADQIWNAVKEGYGEDLATVELNTPDYFMLRHLVQDVWHFSAAKNYQELRAITLALMDHQGNLRSFTEFRNAAIGISDTHKTEWLRSEYELAVASSQMASKWVTIQEDKEDLPLLQYETVGDDRVRPAHRVLEGIIRPVDDAFWDIYYPPNGWRCRCDVKKLRSGKITPDENIFRPDVPTLFQTNTAKKGLVFPPNHPYYIGNPNMVKETADKLRGEL